MPVMPGKPHVTCEAASSPAEKVAECACDAGAGETYHRRRCPVREAQGRAFNARPWEWPWVCRGKVKSSKVSRRRAQRGASAR